MTQVIIPTTGLGSRLGTLSTNINKALIPVGIKLVISYIIDWYLAFHSLVEKIKNESIYRMQSIDQDRSKVIRYAKNIEFTEKILIQFENQKLDIDTFSFNNNLLIRPFFFMTYLDEFVCIE